MFREKILYLTVVTGFSIIMLSKHPICMTRIFYLSLTDFFNYFKILFYVMSLVSLNDYILKFTVNVESIRSI